MVKIVENPIKIDDLGGPPLFLETPVCRLAKDDFCLKKKIAVTCMPLHCKKKSVEKGLNSRKPTWTRKNDGLEEEFPCP